jgi:hypothetical protein
VRLFQGRAWLCALVPPLLLWTAARAADGPNASAASDAAGESHRQQYTIASESIEPGSPRETPLKERNYLDLVPLAAEATRGQQGGEIEGYGPYSHGRNSSLNSLGQRGQSNMFRIDGMDNSEMWLRGTVFEPSLEAIKEVRASSVYIPARLGGGAGAAIEVETRSGGNRFHGSLFDYQQSAALNARNFFDGASKPGLAQSRFGGNLGGPLRRAGGFFLANLELNRERRGLTVISTVPAASQKNGDFGNTLIYDPLTVTEVQPVVFTRAPYAGNQIPASRISQQARNLLALYPGANLPGIFNNYRFTPDLLRSGEQFDARYDRPVATAHRLATRASLARVASDSPGALPAAVALGLPEGSYAGSDPTQGANATHTGQRAWSAGASHAWTPSGRLTNEIRGALTGMRVDAHALDWGLNAASALGIAGLGTEGLPTVQATGYAQLGSAGPSPLRVDTKSFQLEETLNWRSGRHHWTFGAQIFRRHADGTASEWTSRGTFIFTPDYTSQLAEPSTGDAVASLASGFPAEFRRDVQFERYRLRGHEWAGFVQDEFRLGRRVSIQAGLRYSLLPPLTEASGRMVNFNYSRTAPALDQFAGAGGVNQYGGPGYNKRAFAPRIGFAIDVFGNGITVLRGGFSQTYDAGAYLAQGVLARNPPYAARQDFYGGTVQVGLALSGGIPAPVSAALLDSVSLNEARGAIYAMEPGNNYTPYSDQWGLSIQQRLKRGLTLELAGAGSMGMHLLSASNVNQPYPGPTPYAWRRYPYEPCVSRIEYLGYAAGSTYYGGHVKLAGELASGLHVVAQYRLAKSIDDANAPFSSQQSRPAYPQYIYEQRSTRSVSSYDVPQRFTLTAYWRLPFKSQGQIGGARRMLMRALEGWDATTVVILQSGLPFTPELALNGLNNGGVHLPNRVGDGSLAEGERSHVCWFNTSLDPTDPDHAYETPQLWHYGDAGLNILRGPGLATVDGALARSLALTNRFSLRLRVEGYNLFNRVNFALPNRILGLASSGSINHTVTPSRQVQIAAKLEW